MKTTKSTPNLKVGDVVIVHGCRFRLTEMTLDAAGAKKYAESSMEYIWAQKDGPEATARYLEKMLSCRRFRTEFLGYVNPKWTDGIPRRWLKDWTIQGNHYAMWSVET